MLKTTIRPLEDVNNKGVMKAAMKLLSVHSNIFTDQIMKNAIDLI